MTNVSVCAIKSLFLFSFSFLSPCSKPRCDTLRGWEQGDVAEGISSISVCISLTNDGTYGIHA